MSPERLKSPERNVDWEALIEEALTMPGGVGKTYNRFYNYSFFNQVLLFQQGVSEPVATYKRWAEMGRQVQKGSKAKAILRPIAYKEFNDKGVEESKVKGFKMVNCLFELSETEGDELPEVVMPNWNPLLAFEKLDVEPVDFNHTSGNTMGYSIGNEFAVNPLAPYPAKTTFHELAHIILGHTRPGGMAEYSNHRGVAEFQAEATAYLCLNELEETKHFDAAESRAYIQNWLKADRPDDAAIKAVFGAVDKILKAGRE